MKDRLETVDGSSVRRLGKAGPPQLTRQHHRIPLKHSNSDPTDEDAGHSPAKGLSPLSPTLSESSSVSSLSPVANSRRYIRKEKIGQGAQGSVYRCIEVATGREIAVKVIMTYELSPAELEAIKREVKTIKRLHHRHLVEYYKATEKKSKQLSIYMEYVAGGSLSAKLRHEGALPLAVARRYTRQLCEALLHLHQNRIAHRDIKCANIFLSSSGEDIKLGDFGAFKEVGSVSLVGGLKGTPHWMAPEVIRAEQHTSEDGWFKADIWSLGCAVIEMLTGHSPWQQYSNPLTAMYQIVSSNNTPTIPVDATEETASFLKLCLQRNPNDRATIAALLSHVFLEVDDRPCVPECSPTNQQHQSGASNRPVHSLVTTLPESPEEVQRQAQSPLKLRKIVTHANAVDAAGDSSTTRRQTATHIDRNDKSNPHTATPTRSSLKKPSIVPRLKPIELIKSPSNQEKESPIKQSTAPPAPSEQAPPTDKYHKVSPPGISRGASACALSSLDGKTKGQGIPIAPVRLRRISTAPAPVRDMEDILGTTPNGHKVKLPPLSARPASSNSGSS